MELRIRPEPPPSERAAVLKALTARRRDPYSSAWRRAGLDYAGTWPRQTRGATRA